jgi:hypothetical protein
MTQWLFSHLAENLLGFMYKRILVALDATERNERFIDVGIRWWDLLVAASWTGSFLEVHASSAGTFQR